MEDGTTGSTSTSKGMTNFASKIKLDDRSLHPTNGHWTAACGVVLPSVAIVIAWMLLLLPIIFYHLPDEVYARKEKNTYVRLKFVIVEQPCRW